MCACSGGCRWSFVLRTLEKADAFAPGRLTILLVQLAQGYRERETWWQTMHKHVLRPCDTRAVPPVRLQREQRRLHMHAHGRRRPFNTAVHSTNERQRQARPNVSLLAHSLSLFFVCLHKKCTVSYWTSCAYGQRQREIPAIVLDSRSIVLY